MSKSWAILRLIRHDHPWNASELPGIKSAYQLRVSRYDEEGKELREGNLFMQDHPCYCANCLNFKFSHCEYVQITGGSKRHFVMKQIVAEGSNRDSTYFGSCSIFTKLMDSLQFRKSQ